MINQKSFLPKYLWNRLLLAYSYLKRESISRGLPNVIGIELTNYCNLNCIICPREKMKRKVGYMDFSLFKKIVDEVAEYAELVGLDLYGESLLHPKATDMIRYAKEKGLLTHISTNITNMDEKKAKKIIESGLDMIILSFDGTNKETYEKIRKGGKYWDTLENLLTFLKVKKEMKSKTPFTVIQMIYMKYTQEQVIDFQKKFQSSSANIVRLKPFITLDRSKTWMSTFSPTISKKPCIMLWRTLTIFWDGDVSTCCYDYDKKYILGNVNRKTIRELWNGKPMIALRKKHLEENDQEVSLCKDCHPVEFSVPMILGSIFIDDLTTRKLLPIFEKFVISGKTKLLKYY